MYSAALSVGPKQRRQIYNVPLSEDEQTMMRHILNLVAQLMLQGNNDSTWEDKT